MEHRQESGKRKKAEITVARKYRNGKFTGNRKRTHISRTLGKRVKK
jgi:hypothetical protein